MSAFWKIYISAVTAVALFFAGMFFFERAHAQIGPYSSSPHNGLWVMADSGTPCHISTATTTTCKSTPGSVMSVVTGTGIALATVKIYDVAGGSCSGTPGSGLVSAVSLPVTLGNPPVLDFNMNMQNGICVVTSGSTDVTVIYN